MYWTEGSRISASGVLVALLAAIAIALASIPNANGAEVPASHRFHVFVAPANVGKCQSCIRLLDDAAANHGKTPIALIPHAHDPQVHGPVEYYPTIVAPDGEVYRAQNSKGEEVNGGYDNWPRFIKWATQKVTRSIAEQQAAKPVDETTRKQLPKELDAVPDVSARQVVSPETAAQLELVEKYSEMQRLDIEQQQAKAAAATEHEVDWSGVRIIVAVSSDVPSGLKVLEGPVKRTLEQITGGKAELLVVAERTHPTAFADYCQTLGIEVNRAHVSILIPKIARGIARGIVAKKIARGVLEWKSHLPESLHNIPFEEIFERLNGREYHHLVELSVTANAERKAIDGGEAHDWSLYSVLSLIATYVGREWWKGRRDKRAMQAMSQVSFDDEEQPTPTRKKTTRRKGGSRARSSA